MSTVGSNEITTDLVIVPISIVIIIDCYWRLLCVVIREQLVPIND